MSFEVINPLTNDKMTIWDSRRCLVTMFCFAKDKNGEWFVLSIQLGKNYNEHEGYWCCPCGYLDWNESEYFAAVIETFEKTGIRIDENNIVKYNTLADPFSNNQNVSFVFYTILPEMVEFYKSKLTTKFSKPNKISDIEFVHVKKVNIALYRKFAFGHNDVINEIFNKRIKLSWFKKLIMKLYNRYFN